MNESDEDLQKLDENSIWKNFDYLCVEKGSRYDIVF